MNVERLTTYETGLAKVKTNSPLVFQARLYRACLNRLAGIENILGDEYDLDRLRELIQADMDGRCVVLPDVDERARQSMADELQDVFSEWAYEDPDVGLFGMSDGEKELANAFIAALKGERDG